MVRDSTSYIRTCTIILIITKLRLHAAIDRVRFFFWRMSLSKGKGRTIRKVMGGGGGKFFMFAFFFQVVSCVCVFFKNMSSRILKKSDACIFFQTLFVCMDFFSVFSPPSPSLF